MFCNHQNTLKTGDCNLGPTTWSDIATKEFDANARAHYALLQALNDNDISRVIHCKFAHEIWTHLLVTHEGTS